MAVMVAEGSLIQVGDGATPTEAFTTIGQVVSITPPAKKVTAVKTTNLASTKQQYRAGKIPDSGQVKFRIQYDTANTQHTQIEGDLDSPPSTPRNYRLVHQNNLASRPFRTFALILTDWDPNDLEDEANNEVDVTGQITGAITSGSVTI